MSKIGLPRILYIIASTLLLGACTHSRLEFSELIFTLNQPASIRGIDVFDENTVWVAGNHGMVAKTIDGGRTWSELVIAHAEEMDFRDVKIISTSEVLVMSAGSGASSRVYKTLDGGLTWHGVLQNTLEKGFYDGFAFKDGKQGVLGGDPIDGKLYLLVTEDGGDSWRAINSELLPAMKTDEAGGFAASGSHIAVLGDSIWVATGGSVARVFYSKNGGESWQVSQTPMIQGEASQGTFSLDFYDAKHGVAVGGDYTEENKGDGNVMLTEDGGETWRLAENFPVYQSSVRYISKQTLISTGPAASYLSEDGGLNWQKLNVQGYHAIAIGKDKSVWMSGAEGRVAKFSQ